MNWLSLVAVVVRSPLSLTRSVVCLLFSQSFFVEDVTGVPGYPIANCSVRHNLLLHNVMFGGGIPLLLAPRADVDPDNIPYYNKVYPSRNNVVCVGERQWSLASIIPPRYLVSVSVLGIPCVATCVDTRHFFSSSRTCNAGDDANAQARSDSVHRFHGLNSCRCAGRAACLHHFPFAVRYRGEGQDCACKTQGRVVTRTIIIKVAVYVVVMCVFVTLSRRKWIRTRE